MGFFGLHPDGDQWGQACRGLACAGLGLRSAVAHGPAAYIGYLAACSSTCQRLNRTFDIQWSDAAGHVAHALNAVNAHLPVSEHITPDRAVELKQKGISQAIDTAGYEHRKRQASLGYRATLLSEAELGARAFLLAAPSTLKNTSVEPAEFVEEVRARLCIPAAADDCWCPLCDMVLDAQGFHPGSCAAGGERTLRQNSVRDLVFDE